jgi:hypothetical protein
MTSLRWIPVALSLAITLPAALATPAHAGADPGAEMIAHIVTSAQDMDRDQAAADGTDGTAARRMGTAGELCDWAVDEALKLKLPASTPIVAGSFTGTLGTAKKELCSRGARAFQGYWARTYPDHAAVLKNDKWRMFIESQGNGFFVNGDAGERNAEAADLAKAKLWFEQTSWDPEGNCRKSMWVYYRYQFDKNGKLVKESKKQYCGDPGAKAMR